MSTSTLFSRVYGSGLSIDIYVWVIKNNGDILEQIVIDINVRLFFLFRHGPGEIDVIFAFAGVSFVVRPVRVGLYSSVLCSTGMLCFFVCGAWGGRQGPLVFPRKRRVTSLPGPRWWVAILSACRGLKPEKHSNQALAGVFSRFLPNRYRGICYLIPMRHRAATDQLILGSPAG